MPVLKIFMPLLGFCANIYENIYFRKHALTKKSFSFKSEWRSPIIINMAITILLTGFLIEENYNYIIKDAALYVKRVCPGLKEENFASFKDINNKMWMGYTRRARKRNIYKALGAIFE